MAKNVIKTAQPMMGSFYYYGEVRFYAGPISHVRKSVTP